VPAGSQTPLSRAHIRFLLGELSLGAPDLDVLATQLTAALDGPLLLYLSSAALSGAEPQAPQAPQDPQTPQTAQISERLGLGWEDLIRRVCRSPERQP
jgi:hypothetical protein